MEGCSDRLVNASWVLYFRFQTSVVLRNKPPPYIYYSKYNDVEPVRPLMLYPTVYISATTPPVHILPHSSLVKGEKKNASELSRVRGGGLLAFFTRKWLWLQPTLTVAKRNISRYIYLSSFIMKPRYLSLESLWIISWRIRLFFYTLNTQSVCRPSGLAYRQKCPLVYFSARRPEHHSAALRGRLDRNNILTILVPLLTRVTLEACNTAEHSTHISTSQVQRQVGIPTKGARKAPKTPPIHRTTW